MPLLLISDLTRSQTFDDGDDEVFVDKSGKKSIHDTEAYIPPKSPTQQQEASPKSVSILSPGRGLEGGLKFFPGSLRVKPD